MTPARRSDEQLLRALSLKDDGLSWGEIARILNTSRDTLRGAASRVNRDYAASEAS